MNRLLKFVRAGIEEKIHRIEPAAFVKHENFPWAKEIEAEYLKIKEEASALIPSLNSITNFDSVLKNQRALYQGERWKSYFLVAGGEKVIQHQKQCPETSRLLEKIPGIINAFYSILRPGIEIPPHRGPYAGIMRYHLGLVIPEGDLGIMVDRKTYRWREGEGVFFDDSFEHEAWNRTQGLRIILFVDFIRPLPGNLGKLNALMINLFKQTEAAKEARKFIMENQT